MSSSEEDLLSKAYDFFPCREQQIHRVASLLFELTPAPPNVVLYGPGATAKTSIISHTLKAAQIPHAIVRSLECITARHFFERTVAACLEAVACVARLNTNSKQYTRCESAATFASQLQVLLDGLTKFVLVVDDLNLQKDMMPTFFPALARLAETIPCLTVVMILKSLRPRYLRIMGVPHIHFPSYTREEILEIVSKDPLPIFTSETFPIANYSSTEAAEDNVWLWQRYCGVIWDSLGKGVARDVPSFRRLAEKLWDPFVSSIRDGTFGTRDFSRLMVSKRGLFQNEECLVEEIIPKQLAKGRKDQQKAADDLPYYTKYLVCAAYLASFNPPRLDPVYFMKSACKKRKRKSGVQGRPAKNRKVSRQLLSPASFTLERLLAILHAIVPHPFTRSADIYTQIATLSSLGLLQRPQATSAGTMLEATSKWRVNVTYDFAVAVARAVQLDITEWIAE